jgi:hypothetical protein
VKKLKKLFLGFKSEDAGLVFVAVGCALFSVGLAFVVVGSILILQVKPLRSWFL